MPSCHFSVVLIKGEFSQKHNLFRTDGIVCNWNYMFRLLLAIFRFPQYWREVYNCCKNCVGVVDIEISISIPWPLSS